MSKTILELKNIKKSFKQGNVVLDVLKNSSLTITEGEMVALIGESGCGKSTLLQIAGLLDIPNDGKILINGVDAGKLSDKKRTAIRRKDIGFVYQYHYLLPEFTALENVMMPQIIASKKKKAARKKAADLLKKMGLEDRCNHRPSMLSGGEQQRVAIARGLANDPLILLADEPTGNLDPKTAASVFDMLLEQVKTNNLSLFIVTHNNDLAAKTDKILTFKDGKLTKV